MFTYLVFAVDVHLAATEDLTEQLTFALQSRKVQLLLGRRLFLQNNRKQYIMESFNICET